MRISDNQKIEQYYKALVERDPDFIGVYFVGVRTTGIFCISTCRARKPKLKNVVFYSKMKDLLEDGYRPCKVCRPTEQKGTMPDDVQAALNLFQKKQKVKDSDLRATGIAPEKIRRWFNHHYGITFQAYQRMIRINKAYQEIQSGKSITDSAYDAGFNSLSGFGYTFKKVLGNNPNAARKTNVIFLTRISTPLGPMFGCATAKGICLLEFTNRRMLETEFHDLQHRLSAVILAGENEHLIQLKKELAEYFSGIRKSFEVSLDTPTTPFRLLVWEMLQEIPYGKTASYSEQACKIGKPKAVRAVANANGHNRVAIVIPCHRVIGADGNLTGYAGGLERKRWLLEHEGALPTSEQLALFEG